VSYYRRGYSWEQNEYLPAPSAGWNPDAPPTELPNTEAMVIDNLLIRPGKLVMRNPIDHVVDLSAYNPLNVAGYVGGDGSAAPWGMLGRKVPNGVANVDPWNALLVNATATTLAKGSTTAIAYYTTTGNKYTVTVTRDTVPGPRWINFNGVLLGLAYDSTTAPYSGFGTYSQPPVALLQMPVFASGVPATPTVLSGPPVGAVDIKGHLSRVWLLGGALPPATQLNQNTLFFSNPTSALVAGGTDWQDPITGASNYITIDNNTHDFGVGLATSRSGLMILRRSSIWLLRGSTTVNFALQIVSREVGCLDARSILETDQGVYFMSHKGLMMANGTSVKNLSGTVQQTLQAAIAFEQQQIVSGSNTGYITCGLLSDGQIMVSIAYQATSLGGVYTPLWSGLFDPMTNAWTRVTSQIWTAENASNTQGYPGMLLSRPDNRELYSVDRQYVSQIEDVQYAGASIVRVAPVGYGNGAFYDKSLAGTAYRSIPATWVTKYGTLASSARKKAVANRFYMDYVFQSSGLLSNSGYSIAPIDGFGAAMLGPVTVPAIAPSTSSYIPRSINIPYGLPVQQHFNQDFVSELQNDMAFSISWSDSAQTSRPSSGLAELYGVGIEYQPTSDRR